MAVRGYAPWTPKPETEQLVRQVQEVLREYRDYLPISLRQIFYRLVAEYGYEKTEAAYNRLGNHVARARRAQLLDFSSIRDDQGKPTFVQQFESVDNFWDEVADDARRFRLDRMAGQSVRMEVWSEAGMTEQLFQVAGRYGIRVYSSRGFASVTNSHAVAERALEGRKPTVLLHVGDFDPSGESIFESLTKDARAFLVQERHWRFKDVVDPEKPGKLSYPLMDESGPTIIPVRVALTEEQVEEYEVETAPPKASDSRSRNWFGETAQAEALRPDQLASILEEAIESRLDLETYDEVIAREGKLRDEIKDKLEEVAG